MAEIGCTVRLSGPIQSGDLERLDEVLSVPPSYDDDSWPEINSPSITYGFPFATHRLCLNSPGGSFSEALKIAEHFSDFGDQYSKRGIPTGIARGDSCFSACALVFMSGRYSWLSDVENYWHANHVMHPQGQLGFHSPVITLPNGSYSNEQVMEIWGLSMSAIALLSERVNTGDTFINARLFADLVRTAPTDMIYVETVGDAIKWGVNVLHPDNDLMTIDEKEIARNVCDNMASIASNRFSFEVKGAADNSSQVYISNDPEFGAGPVWIVSDAYQDSEAGQRYSCAFTPSHMDRCGFSAVTTSFGAGSGPSVQFYFWKDGTVEEKNGIRSPFNEISLHSCLTTFPPGLRLDKLFASSEDPENVGGSFRLYPGCDSPGNDLLENGVRSVTMAECGNICLDDEECGGFSEQCPKVGDVLIRRRLEVA